MINKESAIINYWEKDIKRETCMRLDEHKPEFVSQGIIRQFNSIDQHSYIWKEIISKLNAPMSNCGAFSCANALIISRVEGNKDIILDALIDMNTIEYEVKQAMTFIHNSRENYIKCNKSDFKNRDDEMMYMRNWAANYELSDYIRQVAKSGQDVSNIFFLRYNQWSERHNATHEEAKRLKEEEIFGGHNTGDKSVIQLEEGASRFIVESFTNDGEHILQRTEDFLKEKKSLLGAIFILDLNGHFTTAIASGPIHAPELIIINTTQSNYIMQGGNDARIPLVVFDLIYPI